MAKAFKKKRKHNRKGNPVPKEFVKRKWCLMENILIVVILVLLVVFIAKKV